MIFVELFVCTLLCVMQTMISEITAAGLAVYCRPHEHQMQELKKNILAELSMLVETQPSQDLH